MDFKIKSNLIKFHFQFICKSGAIFLVSISFSDEIPKSNSIALDEMQYPASSNLGYPVCLCPKDERTGS